MIDLLDSPLASEVLVKYYALQARRIKAMTAN